MNGNTLLANRHIQESKLSLNTSFYKTKSLIRRNPGTEYSTQILVTLVDKRR